jgi:hypothetical protein
MITNNTAATFNASQINKTGIQAGINRMNQSAQTIARPFASSSDRIEAMFQQGIGLYQVKASAKGLEIANKTLDSLLRITA